MPIEKLQGGQPSARDKLNAVIDTVNALVQSRGDEQYISVKRTTLGGLTVGLNINNVIAAIPKKLIGHAFPVLVTKDGGSAGDSITKCSYTYSVYDLNGNLMGKNGAGDEARYMTPEWNLRDTVGAQTYAPANSMALAFFGTPDSNDLGIKLVLWMVQECPVISLPQGLVPVQLSDPSAASSGSTAAAPSISYTLKDMNSGTVTLNTTQTPLITSDVRVGARITFDAASYGTAWLNGSSEWKLFEAFEPAHSQYNCP
jgi:hypothetical protein